MIPTLYAPGATTFTTNGRGRLSDAISCYVEENRNGSYELEMVYPVDGIHFPDITHSCIITAKPADGKDTQPFRIYRISSPIDGKVTINAEHISYQLTHIPVNPIETEQTTCAQALQALKTNAAEPCPFTFWTDKTSPGSFYVKEPKSIRAKLGGTDGSILDAFGGGEYEWDGYTVKLYQHRGADNGVTLRYGKNITDIEQELNIANTITGIYPYWKGQDGTGGETVVILPERVIHHANAANFPYQRTIELDCSEKFQTQPTVAQLRAFATQYMSDAGIGVPKVSLNVSFVALWQTEEYKLIAPLERVNLCDTVTVIFEKLGISATAKVVRTRFDVLKDRYEEIELGDARTSLAQAIKAEAENSAQAAARNGQSWLKAKLLEIENLISSATDGNIVFDYDADGNRTQILAMDTQDLQTAQKVLVINYAGIGGYSGGYGSNNFHLGITTDGKVVAESIDTGTLHAALQIANMLKLGGAVDGNGVIEIYDANDRLIMRGDKTGLKVYAGLIQGADIVAGGLNNTNGTIVVKDENGNEIGRWDKDGAVITGSLKMLGDTTFCTIGNTPTYVNYVVEGLVQRTLENLQYVIPYDSNGHVRAIKTFVKADAGNIQEILAVAGTVAQRLVVITTGSYLPEINTSSDVNKIRGYEERVTYNSTNGAVYRIIPLVGSGHDTGLEIYKNHVKLGKFTCDGEGRIGANRELDIPPNSSSATIDGNTIAYASSSSERYKHDINRSLTGDRDPRNLLNLPVAEFVFNDDHPTQYADMKERVIPGIIAEDVEEIYPSAVIHNEDGEVESWDERRIIPGMLALIQEQEERIKKLEETLEKLTKGGLSGTQKI